MTIIAQEDGGLVLRRTGLILRRTSWDGISMEHSEKQLVDRICNYWRTLHVRIEAMWPCVTSEIFDDVTP